MQTYWEPVRSILIILLVPMFLMSCQSEGLRETTGRISDPQIVESSGLIASRNHPDVFWTHNDDGRPLIFAIDQSGRSIRSFEIDGIQNIDWEDIAVDDAGNLYILDNISRRSAEPRTLVYVLPEPDPFDDSLPELLEFCRVVSIELPSGFLDIESLLIWSGKAYLVSKPWDGSLPAIFVTEGLTENETASFIGNLPYPGMVTGGDISEEGDKIALASYRGLFIYTGAGTPEELFKTEPLICPLNAGQVEGITWRKDDLLLTSEQGNLYLITKEDWQKRRGPFEACPTLEVPYAGSGPTIEQEVSEWKKGAWLETNSDGPAVRLGRVTWSESGLFIGLDLPKDLELPLLEGVISNDFDEWFLPGRVYLMLNPAGDRPMSYGLYDRCIVVGRVASGAVGVQSRYLRPATFVESIEENPEWVQIKEMENRKLIRISPAMPGFEALMEKKRVGFNLLVIGAGGQMLSWTPLTSNFPWDAPSVWGLLELVH